MTRSFPVCIPVLAFAFGGAACNKPQLDASADVLIRVALAQDYAALKAQAHPALIASFPEDQLALLAQSLKRLGPFQSRTMTGFNTATGGVRSASYTLSFAKGTVDLELTLTEGKLTRFLFSGEALKRAMREVQFSEFKVGLFEFRDAAGKPHGTIFKVGERVSFRLVVHGLTRTAKGLPIKVRLLVTAGEGSVVLDKPDFLDTVLQLKPDDPPVATVTGDLTLPRPGMYKIDLRVRDVAGQRELAHAQVCSVEP
jgi:hypothetical protein